MNASDAQSFRETMAVVFAEYDAVASPEKLELWWQQLRGYDISAVQDALYRHLRVSKFAPKIAEVVALIDGSSQDNALRAWSSVEKAVRLVGPFRDVVFDDAVTMRVVHDMGGWIKLCEADDKGLPFVAREFENRYRGFRDQVRDVDHPAILVGIAGAHNRRCGHAVDPPMLVGDRVACERIRLSGNADQMLPISQASDHVETVLRQLSEARP